METSRAGESKEIEINGRVVTYFVPIAHTMFYERVEQHVNHSEELYEDLCMRIELDEKVF